VSGAALALALGAALLHAGWNVLLAGSRDTVATTGALLVWGVVLLAPFALVGGGVSGEGVPFIVASAAFELAYFVLLARAYRDGELGVVYPVARGSAPVVVLVVTVIGLGRGVSGLAALGVVLVAAGVLLVGARREMPGIRRQLDKPPGGKDGQRRHDVLFGLAIGLTIAGYTLVDNEGIEHAEPLAYLFLVTAAVCATYCGALLASGRGPALRAEVTTPRAALTAAATFGAYTLVLAALQRAPAAPVAAVRESSIVIAALMAWLLLREPPRLGPALLVAGGVAAIALG
jgi:drug/metabolite transporter (DMT)-like permease